MNSSQETPSEDKKDSAETPLSTNDEYVAVISKKNDPIVKNRLKLNDFPIYTKEGTIHPSQHTYLLQALGAQNQDLTKIINSEVNNLNMEWADEDSDRSSDRNKVALNLRGDDNSELQVSEEKNISSRSQQESKDLQPSPGEEIVCEKPYIQAAGVKYDHLADADMDVDNPLVIDLTGEDSNDSSRNDKIDVEHLPDNNETNDLISRNQLKQNHSGGGIVYPEQYREDLNLETGKFVIRFVDTEFRRAVEKVREASKDERENQPLNLAQRKEPAPVNLSSSKSNLSREVSAEASSIMNAPCPMDLTPNKSHLLPNDVVEPVNNNKWIEEFRHLVEQNKNRTLVDKGLIGELPSNGIAGIQNGLKSCLNPGDVFQAPALHSQNGNRNLETVATPAVNIPKRQKRYNMKTTPHITPSERLENKSFGNYVVSKMNSYLPLRRKRVEHAFYEILVHADKGYFDKAEPPRPPRPFRGLHPNIFSQRTPQIQPASGHPPMPCIPRDQQVFPMTQARSSMFMGTQQLNPQQESVNIPSPYPPQQRNMRHQYDPQLHQGTQYLQAHQYNPDIAASTSTQQVPTHLYDSPLVASPSSQQLPPLQYESSIAESPSRQQLPTQQFEPSFPSLQLPSNQYDARLVQQLHDFQLNSPRSASVSNQNSPAPQQFSNPLAELQTFTNRQYSRISPNIISQESSDNDEFI